MDRPARSHGRGLRAAELRRAVGVAIGLPLILAVGCTASPSPPPTMAEVLDGPATAQARSAAFESVDPWASGLVVPGLSEVARNQVVECREGHNDWKIHDGYRLKCAAHDVVFLAWDGGFDRGAASVLASLRKVCTVLAFDEVPQAPAGDSIQLGPQGSCPGGVRVFGEFGVGGTRELSVPRDISAVSDLVRWASGPQDEDLWARLKTHRWIFAADVSTVFYQDEVK